MKTVVDLVGEYLQNNLPGRVTAREIIESLDESPHAITGALTQFKNAGYVTATEITEKERRIGDGRCVYYYSVTEKILDWEPKGIKRPDRRAKKWHTR